MDNLEMMYKEIAKYNKLFRAKTYSDAIWIFTGITEKSSSILMTWPKKE